MLGAFSGQAPLFPLPQCVLLPGGVQPLHVFEPRYCDMVRDALAGERLIAMASLLPGFEANYAGNPAIEAQVCVGRIVAERALPEGRYTLILAGMARGRVLSESHALRYRVAQIELEPDLTPPGLDPEQVALELAERIEGLPAGTVRHPERLAEALVHLRSMVPLDLPLGAALDLAADCLDLEYEERLLLLKTPEVEARLAILEGAFQARSPALPPRQLCTEPLSSQRPSWRPPFSPN